MPCVLAPLYQVLMVKKIQIFYTISALKHRFMTEDAYRVRKSAHVRICSLMRFRTACGLLKHTHQRWACFKTESVSGGNLLQRLPSSLSGRRFCLLYNTVTTFFPFRCHSRFCPTCGNKYSMERTTSTLVPGNMNKLWTTCLRFVHSIWSQCRGQGKPVFFL